MMEKLIEYQNDSEKAFEENKNLRTTINYIIAVIIFFASTLISAFTFPFRWLYNKMATKESNSKIIELNDKNIDTVLKNEQLVLIDFWAEWCGPCLMMNTTMDNFANQAKNVKIVKVNADLNRALINRFKVKGLPQFILVQHGEEIKRHAGPMTLNDLNKFCDEIASD